MTQVLGSGPIIRGVSEMRRGIRDGDGCDGGPMVKRRRRGKSQPRPGEEAPDLSHGAMFKRVYQPSGS